MWNKKTTTLCKYLKGVFAKNERGYRLTAEYCQWRSLLILLLSVASIKRKLLKTTNTEERSVFSSFLKKNFCSTVFFSNHKGCNKLFNNEESRMRK